MEEQVYRCHNCGKEFCEEEWVPTADGELAYECPRCHSVWYKSDTDVTIEEGADVTVEEEEQC